MTPQLTLAEIDRWDPESLHELARASRSRAEIAAQPPPMTRRRLQVQVDAILADADRTDRDLARAIEAAGTDPPPESR
jgi:hypothetical protein